MASKQKKIKFRDYRNYPDGIMAACVFRDDYDELPDGAFFAVAEEYGLTDALIEMAEWETKNTDVSDE